MSAQAIFARGSADRKPAFQLITLINQEKGKLRVSKRPAMPEAKEHFNSFKHKYELLTRSGANCSVAKITNQDSNEIVFEFIEGESLQAEFEGQILSNNLSGVQAVFDKVFKLIDSFPSMKTNPSLNEDYKAVFGNSFNGITECVRPACIDLNLDNLFVDPKGKLSLIDYEWVYDFPVPKEFLKLRVLKGAFSEVSTSFLKSFQELSVVSYGEKFAIPAEFEKRYGIKLSNVQKFLETNSALLNYVQNTQAAPPQQSVRSELLAQDLLASSGESTVVSSAQLRLHEEHIKKQEALLKEQVKTIQSLESQLSQLRRTVTHKTVGRAELKLRRSIRKP